MGGQHRNRRSRLDRNLDAVQTAIFGGILVTVGRDSFRLFRESFEIRMHQAALNKELHAALDRAETASRAKTRFLAAASHDLR